MTWIQRTAGGVAAAYREEPPVPAAGVVPTPLLFRLAVVMAAEAARALERVKIAGIRHRRPRLNVINHHCGGAAPDNHADASVQFQARGAQISPMLAEVVRIGARHAYPALSPESAAAPTG